MTIEASAATWTWVDCPTERHDRHAYVLPPGAASPLRLEGSAHDIWLLSGAQLPLEDMLQALSQQYGESTETLREPVAHFVQELEELGVVAPMSRDDMEEEVMIRKVLTVCTGNICRSLFAERALAEMLDQRGLPVVVRSAGTGAAHGRHVPAAVQAALRREGFSDRPHEPTSLTAEMAARADLILTATIEHRDQVLRLLPTAMKRTFSVLEAAAAARYLASHDPQAPRTVRSLARARSAIPSGSALDVLDPYGGPPQGYENMVETMLPAMGAIADFIAATSGKGA